MLYVVNWLISSSGLMVSVFLWPTFKHQLYLAISTFAIFGFQTLIFSQWAAGEPMLSFCENFSLNKFSFTFFFSFRFNKECILFFFLLTTSKLINYCKSCLKNNPKVKTTLILRPCIYRLVFWFYSILQL